MKKVYLTLAEGFENLANAYRDLAAELNTPEETVVIADCETDTKKSKSVDIETVRAVLAEKSRNGKTKEIKALLEKYDAGKLSGVKEEDYADLLLEAEAL